VNARLRAEPGKQLLAAVDHEEKSSDDAERIER